MGIFKKKKPVDYVKMVKNISTMSKDLAEFQNLTADEAMKKIIDGGKHDTVRGNTRPPLGLTPKWIRDESRFIEVCEAISRYYNAAYQIPIEWIEEYNALVIEWRCHQCR